MDQRGQRDGRSPYGIRREPHAHRYGRRTRVGRPRQTFVHLTRDAHILEPAEECPDVQVGRVIRELDLGLSYPEGSQQVIGTTAAPGRVTGDLLARARKGR